VRRERLAEHTAYFNTQPTLASVALGAVTALEEQRAAGGRSRRATVARVKSALGAGARRDRRPLFWFTLRPFAGLPRRAVRGLGSPFGARRAAGRRTTPSTWCCASRRADRHAAGPRCWAAACATGSRRWSGGSGSLGCVLIGVLVAALLAPGGEPASLTFQATLIGGPVRHAGARSARARRRPSGRSASVRCACWSASVTERAWSKRTWWCSTNRGCTCGRAASSCTSPDASSRDLRPPRRLRGERQEHPRPDRLAAESGSVLQLRVSGSRRAGAVTALKELVESRFGGMD
jgi:hypothetical protein